jgi:hypothetical protein
MTALVEFGDRLDSLSVALKYFTNKINFNKIIVEKQNKWKQINTLRVRARFEVFTAVNMKNAVFWDIKTQFVLHRRHITSPLQSPAN